MMVFDHSSLDGSQFLQLYLLLLGSAAMLSFILGRLVRPQGTERPVTEIEELAVLRGGIDRLIEAVSTRLLQARVIGFSDHMMLAVDRSGAHTPIERAIVAVLPARWSGVVAAVRPELDRIADKLIDAGLTGLLIVTAVIAAIRFGKVDLRTSAGKEAARDAERLSERLKRAPTEPEMDRAVALFGTSVLALSAYGQFHRFRHPAGDSGTGSSGCGTSDGGSSGGGCGGCGGD
jgi:hypothetical protein